MDVILKVLLLSLLLVGVALVLLGIANVYQWSKINQFKKQFPHPGKLVDIGDGSLHLHCMGEGTHTVILEGGSGNWSLDWHAVQTGLSSVAKVCVYDRAGHGWSDFPDAPATANQIVEDLHKLVTAAKLKPPFVMVGASFGGAIVQLYEQRYPDEVSHLVLVDARSKDYVKALNKLSPSAALNVSRERQLVARLHRLGLLATIIKLQGPFQFEDHPEALRPVYAHLGRLTKHTAANALELAVDPISDEQLQAIGSIGDKPLVVIAHGSKTMFKNQLGLSDADAEAMEEIWLEQQKQLLNLSSNSRWVLAENSGHLIHQEQPDIVIDEIKKALSHK